MAHFTYEAAPGTDLAQGDVLRRTEELDRILSEIHPHYFRKADYRFFAVLTQSCDLVRREGKACAAPYITVAAVRPLDTIVRRQAERLRRNPLERQLGFGTQAALAKLEQFMERLVNNNEPGYFYLYRQPPIGLIVDHCVFLQLSVPLKVQHYDTLASAKVLQLTEPFQHKLGHLVGTSFSRIGTADWLPENTSPEEFRRLVMAPIDKLEIEWLDGPIHDRAVAELRALSEADRTPERFTEIVSNLKNARAARRKAVLDEVHKTLLELAVAPDVATRARARLESSPGFGSNIR